MEELAAAWLEHLLPKVSERTLKCRHGDLERFMDWLGDRKPTPDVLQAYVADLKQTYAATTARRHADTLSTMFGWAMSEGRINRNPMVGVEKPDSSKARVRTRRLVDRTLAATIKGKEPSDLRDRAIIIVMARTKAVAQDLERMRLSDISGQRKGADMSITVGETKHDFPPRDAKVVRDYLRAREEEIRKHRAGHDPGLLWLSFGVSHFLQPLSFGSFYVILNRRMTQAA